MWRSQAPPPIVGLAARTPGERLARAATRVAAAASVAILLSLTIGWAVSMYAGVVGASRTFLHALAGGFAASLLVPPKRRSHIAALGAAFVVWGLTLALVVGVQGIEEGAGSPGWGPAASLGGNAWWTWLPVGLIYWAAARLDTHEGRVTSVTTTHPPRSRGERFTVGMWWSISVAAGVYLPVVLVIHLLDYGYGFQLPPRETLRAVSGLVAVAMLATVALAIGGLLPGTER